jgi:hypothetical protein
MHLCRFLCLRGFDRLGYVAGRSATRTRRLCGGGNMCCVEKYAAQTAADERSANSILARVHGLHAAVSGGARTSSTHSAQRSSRGIMCRCFARTATHICRASFSAPFQQEQQAEPAFRQSGHYVQVFCAYCDAYMPCGMQCKTQDSEAVVRACAVQYSKHVDLPMCVCCRYGLRGFYGIYAKEMWYIR